MAAKKKTSKKAPKKKAAKKPSEADELFWDCAAQLYGEPGVVESTMFGFKCLRVDTQFVGMPADNQLWVKLPEDQVNELIDSGVGVVCAPAGRPFREWVGIPDLDEGLWMTLLHDSIAFVRPR